MTEELIPSRRREALRRWCEAADLDPDDREAPHVQAFLAGYDAGFCEGYDDGEAHDWMG